MLPYGRSRAEIAAMAARMADPSLRLTLDIQDAASAGKNGGSGQPQEVESLWRRKITSGPLPAFNDKTARERALALLDQYDPDSAFILRKAGLDFMARFSFGNRTFLEGIDTAVHEEYHSVSHSASWDATVYYAETVFCFR